MLLAPMKVAVSLTWLRPLCVIILKTVDVSLYVVGLCCLLK
jgi:hypothetical protein